MNDRLKLPPLVWWIVWAAFQLEIFVIYFFLGSGQPAAFQPANPLWLLGTVPFALSFLVRWLVLARFKTARLVFPIFIIGIALAEGACFLGLFVFPAHKSELFILSVFGILQFVPYFVGRLQE